MLPATRPLRTSTRFDRLSLLAILLFAAAFYAGAACFAQVPATPNATIPVEQIQPGMQGYAYTIFAGDQVEKFDLEVLGVMPNFLGPKQSIILVQLKGQKVEHTGVVAGMSGSPVYINGKLAGALSLKLGIFTKEPIAGVTPIADVLAGGGVASAGAVTDTREAARACRKAAVLNQMANRAGVAGRSGIAVD